MTSRALLFCSLFSELNYNWQRLKSVLSQRDLCKSMPSTLAQLQWSVVEAVS